MATDTIALHSPKQVTILGQIIHSRTLQQQSWRHLPTHPIPPHTLTPSQADAAQQLSTQLV